MRVFITPKTVVPTAQANNALPEYFSNLPLAFEGLYNSLALSKKLSPNTLTECVKFLTSQILAVATLK